MDGLNLERFLQLNVDNYLCAAANARLFNHQTVVIKLQEQNQLGFPYMFSVVANSVRVTVIRNFGQEESYVAGEEVRHFDDQTRFVKK